ncbi:MAG: hypothetical protein IRY99_07435 [Isosphaeraceae bacterium]|nr:hypothetical protein [Isosphaeraceae bacterium]
MAATKKGSTGSKAEASAPKASARKGGTKATSAKSNGRAKAAANGSAKAKKAAPPKLNERQREFLKKIQAAGATGYEPGDKNEERTIQALIDRKLVKKGTKNKESGKLRFLLTKSGEKLLPTASSPAPASEPASAPTEGPASSV